MKKIILSIVISVVSNFGFSQEKNYSKSEEKNGNSIEKPILKKELPAGITAKIIFDNYINVIGGEKAVNSVKTMKMIGSASIPQAEAQLIFTNIVDAEGKLMIEIKMSGIILSKQLVNEKEAFVIQQGQTKKIEGSELVEIKASAIPFEELRLTDKIDLVVSGIETINGNDAYGIINGKTTLYYDVKSGLKTARITTVEKDGNKTKQITYFKDYKEVKGVKVPFNVIQNIGVELDIKMSEVKINEGVSDSDFQIISEDEWQKKGVYRVEMKNPTTGSYDEIMMTSPGKYIELRNNKDVRISDNDLFSLIFGKEFLLLYKYAQFTDGQIKNSNIPQSNLYTGNIELKNEGGTNSTRGEARVYFMQGSGKRLIEIVNDICKCFIRIYYSDEIGLKILK